MQDIIAVTLSCLIYDNRIFYSKLLKEVDGCRLMGSIERHNNIDLKSKSQLKEVLEKEYMTSDIKIDICQTL